MAGNTIARGHITITSIEEPYTVVLSNPAFVVPCNADGHNPVFTGAKTTVQVLHGSDPVLFKIDTPTSTPIGIYAISTHGYALEHTVSMSSIMDYTIKSAIINLDITTEFGYSTTTQISFTKVPQGSTGKPGTETIRYWLELSSEIFHETYYEMIPNEILVTPMLQVGNDTPSNTDAYLLLEYTTVDDYYFENFSEYDNPGKVNSYTITYEIEYIFRISMYTDAAHTRLLDRKIIHYIKDGTNGANGKTIRSRGIYAPGTTYYNDNTFRDVVIYNNQYYIVGSNRHSVINQIPTNTSYWEAFNSFENIATGVLLANDAAINVLSSAKIFITEDNISGWELTQGKIRHTQSGLELTEQGELSAPDTAIKVKSGDTTKTLQQILINQEKIIIASSRVAGNNNLLKNSDFIKRFQDWTKTSPGVVNTYYNLVSDIVPFTQYVRIYPNRSNTDYSNFGIRQQVILKQGTYYTLSYYGKRASGYPYIQLNVPYTDGTYDYLSLDMNNIALNTWSRVEKVIYIQNKPVNEVTVHVGAGYATEWWALDITGIMLVEGSKSNLYWTPSVEDKGSDIVSSINVSPDEIKIKSEKIILDGSVLAKAIKTSQLNINDKFIVDSDGSFQATGAIINGTIQADNGYIGNWNINNGSLLNGTNANEGQMLLSQNLIRFRNRQADASIGSDVVPGTTGINGLMTLKYEQSDSYDSFIACLIKAPRIYQDNSFAPTTSLALSVTGDIHTIGSNAFFEKAYQGVASSDVITSYWKRYHTYLFTQNSAGSLLGIRLPARTVIINEYGSNISFELRILILASHSQSIRLLGNSEGRILNADANINNSGLNVYGAVDMTRGDYVTLRFADGDYYLIAHHNVVS